MPVRVTITEKDLGSATIARLADAKHVRGKVLPRLGREWSKASQVVIGNAVKHRFTGKGPFPHSQNKLGVRSGRLRRSIRATAPQVDVLGGTMSLTMGSNVEYFAIHEFGFSGKVQVRGHTRRLTGAGKTVRGKLTKKSQRDQVSRRQGGGKTTAQVRPHSRRMKIPARAPLGTEIKSLRGRGEFYKATKRAMEGGLA